MSLRTTIIEGNQHKLNEDSLSIYYPSSKTSSTGTEIRK